MTKSRDFGEGRTLMNNLLRGWAERAQTPFGSAERDAAEEKVFAALVAVERQYPEAYKAALEEYQNAELPSDSLAKVLVQQVEAKNA